MRRHSVVVIDKVVYGIPLNAAGAVFTFDTESGIILALERVPSSIASHEFQSGIDFERAQKDLEQFGKVLGLDKWRGGVAVGKVVYGIPRDTDKMLIFDTEKSITTSTFTESTTLTIDEHYANDPPLVGFGNNIMRQWKRESGDGCSLKCPDYSISASEFHPLLH